jgi:hypothetical protein
MLLDEAGTTNKIAPASSEVNKTIKAGIIDNLQYESDLTKYG